MTTIKQQLLSDLKSLGIKPLRGLGQNFLIDTVVYKKIIHAADIKRGETIIEIGPGSGTLTEYLEATGATVIAIEKDRKLAKFLENKFKHNTAVQIIADDILKIKPEILKISQYKIVANLPYYITSHFLRTIFEKWPIPSMILLLVQFEVARRIIAKPPKTNLLALSAQYFSVPKIISKVSRHAFYPAPKVDSAIIRFDITAQHNLASKKETKQIFSVMKAGFSSKRKQLANNLSSPFNVSKPDLEKIMTDNNINPKARPENLTLEQWHAVAKSIFMR